MGDIFLTTNTVFRADPKSSKALSGGMFTALLQAMDSQIEGVIRSRWLTWSARGTARTERLSKKDSTESSTTGGRPLSDSSPRKSKRLRAMEERTTGIYNNKFRRCTVLSWLTPRRLSCSNHKNGSTLEARWIRKEWIPRPDHLYVDRAPPSSQTVRNRQYRASTSSPKRRPVPSTSPNDRGFQGGLGSTMMVRGGRASVRR